MHQVQHTVTAWRENTEICLHQITTEHVHTHWPPAPCYHLQWQPHFLYPKEHERNRYVHVLKYVENKKSWKWTGLLAWSLPFCGGSCSNLGPTRSKKSSNVYVFPVSISFYSMQTIAKTGNLQHESVNKHTERPETWHKWAPETWHKWATWNVQCS